MTIKSYLLFVLLLLGIVYSQYTPLFVWSDNINFSKDSNGAVNGQITNYSNIKNYISSLLKSGRLDELNDETNYELLLPEIIVVYLKSELSSNDLGRYSEHFDSFRKMFKDSKFTLTIPFLRKNQSPSFDSILYEISSYNSTVYYYGEHVLTSNYNFNNNIHKIYSLENNQIFNNNKVDLLIIPIEDMNEIDIGKRIVKEMDIIKNTNDIISSLTKGKFVSIFTGSNQNKQYSSSYQTTYNHHSRADDDDDDDNKKEYDWHEYLLRAWFWEGLVVVGLFLFIVITVNVSFLGMQTPDRFSKYQVDIKE